MTYNNPFPSPGDIYLPYVLPYISIQLTKMATIHKYGAVLSAKLRSVSSRIPLRGGTKHWPRSLWRFLMRGVVGLYVYQTANGWGQENTQSFRMSCMAHKKNRQDGTDVSDAFISWHLCFWGFAIMLFACVLTLVKSWNASMMLLSRV